MPLPNSDDIGEWSHAVEESALADFLDMVAWYGWSLEAVEYMELLQILREGAMRRREMKRRLQRQAVDRANMPLQDPRRRR